MKAIKEDVLYQSGSFSAYLYEGPSFDHPYHFHVEHEIVLVNKGSGTLLVNDQACEFNEGDIFILGANTPHSFISAEGDEQVRSLVIQFSGTCFGETFFHIPEFRTIGKLLESAKFGLRIKSNESHVEKIIENTCISKGALSVVHLLTLLTNISQLENIEQIIPTQSFTGSQLESHKLNAAIDWVNANYFCSIDLEEIAEITNLTKTAFCRSFKKATSKTFLQYLNDKRIEEAATRLIQSEDSILKVAYDVGFSNISSFNRYFKKVKGTSPTHFRENFRKLVN
ncbi:AraC family transcriptional regulator [Thalassotalea sp. PLHSN55]|uniref:AraC family transcriptional regulator n=1 Tax=Thalassotalea sp. PLHSN55 TaxID=3435888 RepID=UPI003F8634D8